MADVIYRADFNVNITGGTSDTGEGGLGLDRQSTQEQGGFVGRFSPKKLAVSAATVGPALIARTELSLVGLRTGNDYLQDSINFAVMNSGIMAVGILGGAKAGAKIGAFGGPKGAVVGALVGGAIAAATVAGKAYRGERRRDIKLSIDSMNVAEARRVSGISSYTGSRFTHGGGMY